MASLVDVERDGGTTRVRLNRPEKLNAFSATLVDELLAAVQSAAHDGTRLLVFCAEGKGFSGGFDFSDLDAQSNGDLVLRFVRVEMLLQAVYHAPHATLALVHGACYGAAADLVLACTERVAAPGARLRMPGLNFGVVLGTRRLANTIGVDAARSVLETTRVVEAEEARALGMVHALRPAEEWDSVVTSAAERAQALAGDAQAQLHARLRPDTRDADLAALVSSVARGDLKRRIQAYVSGG